VFLSLFIKTIARFLFRLVWLRFAPPFPILRTAEKKERQREGRGFHGDSSHEFLGHNIQFWLREINFETSIGNCWRLSKLPPPSLSFLLKEKRNHLSFLTSFSFDFWRRLVLLTSNTSEKGHLAFSFCFPWTL
jgi:hypothetical protein